MIHSGNPFSDEPGSRDPVRRLRGRLASPVTIITAGTSANRTGLTVSALAVVEGEPAQVHTFISPASDLWTLAAETRRFIVHILGFEHATLAEVFAGLRPSPGGLFATAPTTDSDWGPVLSAIPNRAFCTVISHEEVGFSGLMAAAIDRTELSDFSDPLVYFRARYRRLG